MGSPTRRSQCSRKSNLYVAYALPFVIFGLLGFASWVFTTQICLLELRDHRGRPAVATALIVLHYLTLALLLAPYFRLVATVHFDPGYVPLPAQTPASPTASADPETALKPRSRPPPNAFPSTTAFTSKSIFTCEADGYPRYCSTCQTWKPDRAHHCSEVNRCVYRMDHFCPWVGGVVSETSTRYFFQTVLYGLVHTLFLVIATAYTLGTFGNPSTRQRSLTTAVLVLACLFAFFTAGMVYTTFALLIKAKSTIDTLSPDKVYTLAMWDPNPAETCAYPRIWLDGRCFVLVRTQAGVNPWCLGSWWENFREEMGGEGWWKLWGVTRPGEGGGEEGFYRWNEEVVGGLRKQAGIGEEAEKRQ